MAMARVHSTGSRALDVALGWVVAVALLVPFATPAQTLAPSAAALRLVEATPTSERAALLLPFSDAARSNWHYTPRSRDGVAWKTMSAPQRDASLALHALGAERQRSRQGARFDVARNRAARTRDLRLDARPRQLCVRDLRRARRAGVGLAHRGPSPVAALHAQRGPACGDAAAVLRREPCRRAARHGRCARAAQGLCPARRRRRPGAPVARKLEPRAAPQCRCSKHKRSATS